MRVAVVDGHPVMRMGLVGLLGAEEIEVVGDWDDGDEALRVIEGLRPDLIVLGLNLAGGTDGVALCRRIKSLPRAPRVLVYTAYNYAENIASCMLAGADSYLHKHVGAQELLDAVRRTIAGEKVWNIGDHVGEPRSVISITPDGAQLTPQGERSARAEAPPLHKPGDRQEASHKHGHGQAPRQQHPQESRENSTEYRVILVSYWKGLPKIAPSVLHKVKNTALSERSVLLKTRID